MNGARRRVPAKAGRAVASPAVATAAGVGGRTARKPHTPDIHFFVILAKAGTQGG
jgi:hypothetical protein